MSNYFVAVTSKSVKSDKQFDYGDLDLEGLSKYLKEENRILKDQHDNVVSLEDGRQIMETYKEWWDLISLGYNIIVTGIGSKKRLLDTFAYGYLRHRKHRVLLFHGFVFVPELMFASKVLGMEEQVTLNSSDLIEFSKSLSSKNQLYIIVHSLDEFYRQSNRVYEIMLELMKLCPDYVHLIASSDDLTGPMVTSYYQLDLKFFFFHQTTYRSFFFERCAASGENHEDDGDLNNMLLQDEFTLQSLTDVYSALQDSNKKILTFILDYFVNSEEEEDMNETTKKTRSKKRSKGPKKLLCKTLFDYTEREFLARRQLQLRSHLTELIDHKIIIMDGHSRVDESIVLQVPLEIAKKFLETVKPLDD